MARGASIGTLTFFARHASPASSSFFFLFPPSDVVDDAPAAKVRSTSHTLTSTSLPAMANMFESGLGDEMASNGERMVRLDDARPPFGWRVRRPEDKAEIVPLFVSHVAHIPQICTHPCTDTRPDHISPDRCATVSCAMILGTAGPSSVVSSDSVLIRNASSAAMYYHQLCPVSRHLWLTLPSCVWCRRLIVPTAACSLCLIGRCFTIGSRDDGPGSGMEMSRRVFGCSEGASKS